MTVTSCLRSQRAQAEQRAVRVELDQPGSRDRCGSGAHHRYTVTAAIPDDDVACAREIQVLHPSRLWEVKVAGDGSIISVEESDETDPED